MDDLSTYTVIKLSPGVTAFGAAPIEDARSFNNRRVYKPTSDDERKQEYFKEHSAGNGGRRKLTEQNVIDMCIARKEGATLTELAEEYGVAPTAVSRITLGKTWTNVIRPITPAKKRQNAEERRQRARETQNDYWKRLRKEESLTDSEAQRIAERRRKMSEYQQAYRQRLKYYAQNSG